MYFIGDTPKIRGNVLYCQRLGISNRAGSMTQAAHDHKPLGRAEWFTLAAALLGWMFSGLEQGLFPLVARPALQDLLHVNDDAVVGLWNGRFVASFLLGAAFGGLVFGWLGDRIGRVRALALSILVYSGFTGAGYLATQAWHLTALRFVASLGMGGEWALGVALVMECWPDHLRPMLAGIIGAASNVGILLDCAGRGVLRRHDRLVALDDAGRGCAGLAGPAGGAVRSRIAGLGGLHSQGHGGPAA